MKANGLSFACICPTFANTDIIHATDGDGKLLHQEDANKFVKTIGIMP